MICRICGGEELVLDGHNAAGRQRNRCKNCNAVMLSGDKMKPGKPNTNPPCEFCGDLLRKFGTRNGKQRFHCSTCKKVILR